MQGYPWTPLRSISFGKSWLPDLAADASTAKQNLPAPQPLNVQIRLMKVTLVSEKRCSKRLKCWFHSYGYLVIVYNW